MHRPHLPPLAGEEPAPAKAGVGENLAAVIKDIEKQMREAATNLEFEKAARFRDEIKRLREMELDTLEGGSLD